MCVCVCVCIYIYIELYLTLNDAFCDRKLWFAIMKLVYSTAHSKACFYK